MATKNEVADLLGLSPKRVGELTKKGTLPKSKGQNGYDLLACNAAYITHLKSASNGQEQHCELDVREEQAKNLAARTELTRLDLGIKQDEYLPISILEDVISKFATESASIFDAAVAKLKQKYPSMSFEHHSIVLRIVAEARNNIAGIRFGQPPPN